MSWNDSADPAGTVGDLEVVKRKDLLRRKGQTQNKMIYRMVFQSIKRVALAEVREISKNEKNDCFPIPSPKSYPTFTMITCARVPRQGLFN